MDVEFEELPCGLTEDELLASEYFYLKGDDIQKLSVIQALPQLLQTEPQQTYTRIIPKILQELPNSSCEFHVMTSKVFRLLMERQVPVNLLHAVLQGIESRDPIAANAWMETLLATIGILSETQIKHDIIPLANSKSLLSQPIGARIASSRILGRLAVHKTLDSTDVKRDVLPLAQSLCQDCHPDVRTAMCLQLPHIAQGLGTALVKANLLSSLVELASDDNMYVRSASVGAVVQIFPHINLDIKKATILPLVRQLCERSMRSDDITATTIAREIGKLVDGLQFALTVADCMWFLEYYKTLVHRGLNSNVEEFRLTDGSMDVICRQHCAANLPAMSLFTFSSMPMQTEFLYGIFRDLAADPCYLVRRTVAGCLHEVIKIFGPQSRLMKSDFVRLLRDDSEDVLQMLVPHMGNTLELFCTYGTLSRQLSNQSGLEIGRSMLKCQFELSNGYNWRLLTHFIHQLEHLPNCMPPDFIHQHFTPVVLTSAVQGRAKPVRSQAVRTLLVFLRYNGKEMQRKWLRDNMVTQLCNSNSCYTRHIFIRLCVNAIDIFSEKYFKQYFFDFLLDLADDPVANIRLCVADLFTLMKQMLVLPEDKLLNTRLNDVFKKYTNQEKDRDVMAVFKRKMQEINSGSTANKDEHAKEQKRRLDEEDRIMAGGKSLQFTTANKNTKNSRQNSITKPVPSLEFTGTRAFSQRSLSVPPKPGSSANSVNDMSFLEQHFYIDAGVNLPTKPLNNVAKAHSAEELANNFATDLRVDDSPSKGAQFSKHEGDSLSLPNNNWPSNITDDDKVNLRKLSSSHDRKNKRYSSVLSATCLEKNQERKSMNRRSLNVTAKEMSRIPVSSKSSPRKPKSTLSPKESEHKKVLCENEWELDRTNDNDVDLQRTANRSGAKTLSNNNLVSNSKDNLSPSGSINGVNQSSSRSPSQLPVLKRRSQSENRK